MVGRWGIAGHGKVGRGKAEQGCAWQGRFGPGQGMALEGRVESSLDGEHTPMCHFP